MSIKTNILLLWIFSTTLLLEVAYMEYTDVRDGKTHISQDNSKTAIVSLFIVTSLAVFLSGIMWLLA